MTTTGFYERRSVRPGGLALVIALHAAAFAGLVLVKTDYVVERFRPTQLIDIPMPPQPKEEPPPEPRVDQPRQPSVIEAPAPLVPTRPQGPIVTEPQVPPLPPSNTVHSQTVVADATPEMPRAPVRTEATFDPRFAGDLQPPYPASEQSAQRDGTVRIRVTVGTDGRVKAAECLAASREAFCRATQRHARTYWRFRPATLDGRPVEATKTMNLIFRIET